jgi:hypothetical protein
MDLKHQIRTVSTTKNLFYEIKHGLSLSQVAYPGPALTDVESSRYTMEAFE